MVFLAQVAVRLQLQLGEADLAGRGVHHQRRPRRPLVGMLLHLDGSRHAPFADFRRYDLLVVLDDATSEIYYAQLIEQESRHTVLEALREWSAVTECFAV